MDTVEGIGTIDLRLSRTEKVEIGSVNDRDMHRHGLYPQILVKARVPQSALAPPCEVKNESDRQSHVHRGPQPGNNRR